MGVGVGVCALVCVRVREGKLGPCVHTHTYTRTRIHTHIYTCTHTHEHTHMNTHTHTQRVRARARVSECTYVCFALDTSSPITTEPNGSLGPVLEGLGLGLVARVCFNCLLALPPPLCARIHTIKPAS